MYIFPIIGYAADTLYPLRKIVYFANVINISQKNQQQKDWAVNIT